MAGNTGPGFFSSANAEVSLDISSLRLMLVMAGFSVRKVLGPAGGIAKCKSLSGVLSPARPYVKLLGKFCTLGAGNS